MKNLHLISFLFILFLISGCAKKVVPVNNLSADLEYYPITTGKFVEYEVDSVIYTEIPRDTIVYSYRVREKIADQFTDNTGKPAVRLERYIKIKNPQVHYDSLPWTMKEVWMVNADQQKVQVMEGNVRYTKLIFPVIEKESWDGNAANTIGQWLYWYEYINQPESVNGQILEKVLLVNQKRDSTAISYRRYSEKYAAGIGLVYREIIDLHSNNVVLNVPVESRIERGTIYKQTFVTFGYE